jgi:hypothetical protein
MNRIQAYFTPNKKPSGSSSRAAIRLYFCEPGFKAAGVSAGGCRGRCDNKPLQATTLHAASPSPDHLQLNQFAALRLTGRTPHVRRGNKSR